MNAPWAERLSVVPPSRKHDLDSWQAAHYSPPATTSRIPGPERVLRLCAVLVLLLLVAVAAIAPMLFAGDPSRINLGLGALAPSSAHPFGTDLLGRDVLKLAAFGARVSLAVGISAAAVSALLGLALGIVAAYRGGIVDSVVCRAVDAALAVPAFFVLIAVQSLLGPGVLNVVVTVSLVSWMATARVVRALVLSLKTREFVVAAKALGCSGTRIVARHLLPNIARQVGVMYTFGVADALLMESALSFLGLGVPATVPSWGNMLSGAQAGVLSGAWWLPVFPGGLILLTTLSINFLGDSIGPASPAEA